jgi:hypothetical protein
MNGIELFERIQQVSTFELLLQSMNGKTKAETQSKRGNLFEKVWDIIIKFGFYSILPNDIYDHYEGNINTCKLKKVADLEIYLRDISVFSKGKGGASDITLQNKKNGKWVFMSSKFYLDDSKKSIDDYDVEKILAIVKQHSHKYKECDIYLVVNNKQKVMNVITSSQSTNNYIKENIHHILDLEDLEICFQNLKHSIQHIAIGEVNSKFCNAKVPLLPRFHQVLTGYKIMERINEGEKEFLTGFKPRAGKTYEVGYVFIEYHTKYLSLNALIITPAPTETLSQFTDDLFHKFRDFNGINIVEIKKGTDFETMILQGNNIIIVSKQLLDDYVFEKKIEAIRQLNLDFIVFDENHFHGTTIMSKNILQSYSSPKTIKLYLTATYAKPLSEWNIPLECQFYWDIEDEQLCKNRNIQGLVEKHGEDVLLFLTEENKEQLLSIYDKMPDLHILTNMMDRKRFEVIKEQIKDTSYGFSNGTLLSGNFPNEVDTMLRYITGSNKEQDYPKKDLSIFGRIKRIAIEKNSRTRLNNGDFTSQLWFLPFGINMTINKVSEHLKDRMGKNSILKNYEIKIVNSKKEYKLKDIKEEIKNWELKAKEEGKDGLILLAGNQLTLGITLPFVDVVFLFNDIVSSDKIIQMMYRCMTESINNSENDKINNGIKKMGFVVDLNISRVLNTCLDYNVYKKDLNVEQKITYLVENNLINIDSDLFKGKENKTKLVEKLLNLWKADPIHNLKILLKKIEESVIDMDTKDQKMINRYFTSSIGDEKVNVNVRFDEESEEALPTGKETIKQDTNETEDAEEKEDGKNIDISLTKDVLPFIIPLICILTMNTEHKDILEMLNVIKTGPSLLSVFQDQSFIWWNKPDIIKLIEAIVEKYIRKNSCIYNISIQFKMSLQSLIDKPKELLELIDSCLKSKQKERQENGEVFTRMCLVFEMLDNLDKRYINEHGRSIFTEPSFKWFDPASGMGNFPVAVYLKLMDGLKTQIPNDEARKKHIIENMLYMSELNKKNVFISHQIFNMNNQYKLNLYEGDTLELDIVSVFGLNSFDVVLGNPPYNKGGIRSHTGKQLGDKNETIWTKFIEKSFEWLKPDGFLAFINPLSWLKKSHSLHNEMLEKHIVWLKLWDNSQSKGMINADIPISLYVLQNTPNTTHKKTEITSILKRRSLTTTSTEYLNPKYSIPLAFHSIFGKLVGFIETRNLQLEYKTKTIKSSGTKAKIPTEYTLEDMWVVDTYTIKEGLMVKKALEQHPDANKRKLIISNKASFTGAFIDEGKLGLTGNDKSYIIGDNLELILKLLSFKISGMISHFTKYRQDFLEKEVYTYLPDIRKLGIADITEDDFYKLIGLTKQEINQIKNPLTKEVLEDDEVENEMIEIEVKPKAKKVIIRKQTVNPKINLLIVEDDEVENEMIKNEMIKNEMIKNEMIKNEMIKNEMIKNEMIKIEVKPKAKKVIIRKQTVNPKNNLLIVEDDETV